MLQIKRLLIILLVLSCCCSKSILDEKRYRTAVCELDIYTNPKETYVGQEIGTIPFKERVEIVDNNEVKVNDYQSFIKIKYKDTVGYVLSSLLSERSDIPFVDNVKYNYTLNEFEYNRKMVIDLTKKNMIEYDKIEVPLTNEYYIEDPQIYSFYGDDCYGRDTKFILVIMISKLRKDFYHFTIININNKNEYYWFGSGTQYCKQDNCSNSENIKDFIGGIKGGGFCP